MDDPSSSRHFLGRLERFGKSRVPARRAVAPSFALLLLISADYGLPASHAAARELTYPA